VPALLTGLIQETLKLIPLLLAGRWLKLKPIALISLGAFIGAGFGWVEACHIVAPLFQARALTGYTLIERVFTIMFHATMGAALGYGVARKQIWQFWLAAVGLHTLGTYLIVFVQLKMLTIKSLNIIIGLYDIVLLIVMVGLQRMYKAAQSKDKKAQP
jgi:RsiW-degrading membrane proteinase PrsW (M82 family)